MGNYWNTAKSDLVDIECPPESTIDPPTEYETIEICNDAETGQQCVEEEILVPQVAARIFQDEYVLANSDTVDGFIVSLYGREQRLKLRQDHPRFADYRLKIKQTENLVFELNERDEILAVYSPATYEITGKVVSYEDIFAYSKHAYKICFEVDPVVVSKHPVAKQMNRTMQSSIAVVSDYKFAVDAVLTFRCTLARGGRQFVALQCYNDLNSTVIPE